MLAHGQPCKFADWYIYQKPFSVVALQNNMTRVGQNYTYTEYIAYMVLLAGKSPEFRPYSVYTFLANPIQACLGDQINTGMHVQSNHRTASCMQ